MYNNLVNITTLLVAGHRFAIRDSEATLTDASVATLAQLTADSGELPGLCAVDASEAHANSCKCHSCMGTEARTLGMTDDASDDASDDMYDDADRWGHVADGHISEMRDDVWAMARTITGDCSDWRQAAERRQERTSELCRWFTRKSWLVASATRKGQSKRLAKLQSAIRAAYDAIKARRNAALKLIITAGERDGIDASQWAWHLAYLTKAQLSDIESAARLAYRGKRAPAPLAPVVASTLATKPGLPAGTWNRLLADALYCAAHGID